MTKVYGGKIGSRYSVLCDHNDEIKIDLTSIAELDGDLVRGTKKYIYGKTAKDHPSGIDPIHLGIIDEDLGLERGVELLGKFFAYFTQKMDENSGSVWALPLIKQEGPREALKAEIRARSKSRLGTKFISEAWASGIATLGKEILTKVALVINCGSSTTEVVLTNGKKMIYSQVIADKGGSHIDKILATEITSISGGLICTEAQARSVKESYSYDDDNDVEVKLTKKGRFTTYLVKGKTIKEIIDMFASEIADIIMTQFMRAAASKDQLTLNSFQGGAHSVCVVSGGLINMEGFTPLLQDKLIEYGLNDEIPFYKPDNGTIAPAIGAKIFAGLLEDMRVENGWKTWDPPGKDDGVMCVVRKPVTASKPKPIRSNVNATVKTETKVKKEKEKEKFPCPICGQVCATKAGRTRHVNAKHKGD